MAKPDLNKIRAEIDNRKRERNISSSLNESTGTAVAPRDAFLYELMKSHDTGAETSATKRIKLVENQVAIKEISDSIFNSLEQLGAGADNIALDSQDLANNVSNIESFITETQNKIKEIDKVIQNIKDIASRSNLLSLNAAIEAARAGDAGRGFSVVASEMGKLANISKESSVKVEKSLTEIQTAIKTIGVAISKIETTSESQAAATEEISATTNEIVQISKKLAEISKNF